MADELTIEKLQNGVQINIDGKTYKTLPANAKILEIEPNLPERNPPIRFRKNIPTTWIALSLIEGKNRQVRKMTAAVDLPTLRLVRYSIGKVTIENISPGEYIECSESVIGELLSK
jgi:23S rRNA pseudouridine2457 synthase